VNFLGFLLTSRLKSLDAKVDLGNELKKNVVPKKSAYKVQIVEIRNSIDFRRVKKFAAEDLPLGSSLREILLAENDEMDATTYLARIPVFLHLMRLEGKGRRVLNA
jgi:hypothetical protein